ncbi:MAG: DUF4040 domain-containing protein [Wenzhouxiangella sp.]|nr:MAG: DUF4040 domain-containing protein [Wenzhouxiangella sp.]
MNLAIDALIGLGLVILAWQTISGRSLFRGIVLFVVFGLTMALAWARMGAPDLALAEAAIGAGVTGALMLVAYRRLVQLHPEEPAQPNRRRSRLALPIAALAAGLVAVIGLGAVSAEREPGMAGLAVMSELADTGLGNPITGVLLKFRNLDTLLEVAVLLAAFLAARTVFADEEKSPTPPRGDLPLVGALLAIIIPLTILVAVHLLLAGSREPGGAFQAGAVLAACGVLLILSGRLQPATRMGLAVGLPLVLGLLVFSLVGLAALVMGAPLLALPGLWTVYLIETAMMISIALTLVLLFAGASGLRRGDS